MDVETHKDTFKQEVERAEEETPQEKYVDDLYATLLELNLLNEHQHGMAHKIICLIAAIQQIHKDLENPPEQDGTTKSPLAEFFDTIRAKIANEKG